MCVWRTNHMKNNDINVSKRIGEIIKSKRKRKNISQAELGEHLGVTHTTVSRYESGGLPITVNSLDQIASFCGFKPLEYMKAFYSDDDVRRSLRKIMGNDNKLTSRKVVQLENKIINDIPDSTKLAIVSAANSVDSKSSADCILDLTQNYVIEIIRKQDSEQEKRLLKYMECFRKVQ